MLDIFQVFGTGFMGQVAEKMIELKLPVLIMLPTHPIEGFIVLGIGDIFLSGLLSLQTTFKFGQQAGILNIITISIAMFFFEIVAFNTAYFTHFPATIIILLGWFAGVGLSQIVCQRRKAWI